MQEDIYKQDNNYETQENGSQINESKQTNKYKFDFIQEQQNLQNGQQQTNNNQVNQFQVQNQLKYMEIENENKDDDYQNQTKNYCKQNPSFNKNIGDLQEISPKNTLSEEDQNEKQNNQQKQQNFYFSQNKIGAVSGKKFKKKNNIDYKQFQIQENSFNSDSEDYNNNENSDQNKSQNSGSNSKKKPQIQIQQKIGEQRVYNFKTKKNFQFSQSQSNIEFNSQNPDDQYLPEKLGMSENYGKSTQKNVNNKIDLNDLEDFKFKNNAKKKKSNNNIYSVNQQGLDKNSNIDNEINDNDNLYTKASISDETKNLNFNSKIQAQNQQQQHIEDQLYIQNNYDSDNNVIPRQKILNKQKRLQLNGYSCPDCEKFYRTIDPDGEFQLQNNCSKHRDIRPPLIQKVNNSDDSFSQ
ncbi:hypothetical protein PPERSA_05821 [Pseudocohnilembus persalinus]|uniref:Uncharacterized protein n=1 Tax=Pseudocohnilembus persalinus TaxID=266149 RepID=A0A0V0QG72_PSEPJ|nr:hypothetical protein PPERSA_05821 [Pseudocohnilembus persalinus]|eukprot:KRX01235.1 hypothetical protein PPERSA_05821 [Pseudocohnilembus persalinus]